MPHFIFSAFPFPLYALEHYPNSSPVEYLSFNPHLDVEFVNSPFWLLLLAVVFRSQHFPSSPALP